MLQLIPHCEEQCPLTSWGCHNSGFKVQLKAVDGDAKPKNVFELGASSSLAGSHRFEDGQGGRARMAGHPKGKHGAMQGRSRRGLLLSTNEAFY